jgi:hypothetical protein
MDRVPNAPPRFQYYFYQFLGLCIFAVYLVPVTLLQVVRYCIPSWRVHRKWSLRRHLAVALGRTYFAWSSRWALPRPQGEAAWQKQDLVHKLVGKGTRVDSVTISPINDNLRVGVAAVAVGIVPLTDVPGFWSYETGKWQRGDEQAREGERVILYAPGGYVVSPC